MAYDPTKPANGSPISSGELRAQLQGLKDICDSKANEDDSLPRIQQNSSGPIAGQVDFLSLGISNPPTQAQVQSIADKIDELITVLKRT